MPSQIVMFTDNQFTTYDPLMLSMASARPAFIRGTPLLYIVRDGWERGFDPAQTAMEAVHMGYSLCVVLPLIKLEWTRIDAEYAAFEAECCTSGPDTDFS